VKSLRDYITESEVWIDTPATGDDFAFNVQEECLLETYILEQDQDRILVYADHKMFDIMEGYGFFDELTITEGVMSEIDIDLQQIAQNRDPGELIDALRGNMGSDTAEYLRNMMDEIEQDLEQRGQRFQNDVHRNLDILMDRIVDMYAGQDMSEAEYQGRKVQLGKPMQGDVKKFKVYVKDPKTGNVKKVNFGDKTMRIKKSNPARRRSFRARHNCANPGPRTKARYWSCRKW
jgi:hypothetical protein